jgi:hypothetical protein
MDDKEVQKGINALYHALKGKTDREISNALWGLKLELKRSGGRSRAGRGRMGRQPPQEGREAKHKDAVRVELVVEHLVLGLQELNERLDQHEPIGAETLEFLRIASKHLLRTYRLPVPDDAELAKIVRNMVEWHDLP